ncbi:hypothetical protein V494_06247 [Pseudogymnoascus sp. VKM F-4513 (FW-928)]|nr:hypothetical protein V494_06247 [Pseudogymnoascus sp. VKM F-4513 (FW-928)]
MPGNPGMINCIRSLLSAVHQVIPRSEPEAPTTSQFFNFTDIKIEDADCSNDDLAAYKSFVQTEGEVGRRTSLTDYFIAKKFQPVVKRKYEADLTVAQMTQLRIELKESKRFVGHGGYLAVFKLAEKKASQNRFGNIEAEYVLDVVLLAMDDKLFGLNEKVMGSLTGGLKLAVRMLRDGIYDIMKAYRDRIYEMEKEEEALADKASKSLWDLVFEKKLAGVRTEVAAQLELIEALDMAFSSF